MKPKKDTVITILILLLLIIFFSYKLYGELFKKSNFDGQEIIGVVSFKERTVQRKFDISAVWDEVENTMPVANRDTIRTMDFADAVLTLNDDTKIKLSDNSMIYLDFEKKKLNINFEQGSISTISGEGSDSKISIKSGDKTVEMGQGATKISKNEDDNIDVKVESGNALVKLNGKEQLLEKNQTAEIKNTNIDVRPLRFQLISPTDSYFFAAQTETLEVELKWAPIEKVTDLKLEIANDKKFQTNLKTFLITKDSSKSLKLSPANYYWRLNAKNIVGGKQEFSEIRKFRIVSEKPIRITTPVDGKVFQFTKTLPVIPIGWIKNDFASTYKIEISTDSEFKKIIKSDSLFQNSTSVEIASKGIYFVRVITKPTLPDILPLTTPTIKFIVEEQSIPNPPEPISPNFNTSYSSDFFQKGKVNFTWRENRDFDSYDLEISKNSDFSSTIIKQTINKNFFQPTFNESPGDLFYRVRGILPDGRKSEFSKVVLFKISEPENLKLIYPENSSEIDLPSSNEIVFKWTRPETSGSFQLEVSKDKSFGTTVFSEVVKTYSKSIPLNSDGIYYWKIKLISKDNTEILKSETFSFTVATSPFAKLLQPSKNSNINLVGKEEIVFSWEKNPAAVSYELEIQERPKASPRTIFKATVADTNFSFKDLQKFKDAEFSWGIAINYLKKDGKINKSPFVRSEFTVQVPKVDAPIAKPILPANGSDILIGDSEEILFTWEKNDKALYYQIDLHEQNSKRPKPIFQKQTNELSTVFQIPNTISDGAFSYELYIYYKNWEGKILKSNPTKFDFKMKMPSRTPPVVVLKSPINSVEVKPDDKWQIFLEWEPIEKANFYSVSVRNAATNKIYFQENTTKNSSIFVASDSAIKTGSYKWSVVLNYKSKEGKDLKTNPKTGEFVITLPPAEVPIPNPISPEPKQGFNLLEAKEVQFTWDKNENANSYIWELYENLEPNTKPIMKQEIFGQLYSLKDLNKFKDGIYYWKLYATYKDRSQKIIRGEPIVNEFSLATPEDDKLKAPEILNNPRLYVE